MSDKENTAAAKDPRYAMYTRQNLEYLNKTEMIAWDCVIWGRLLLHKSWVDEEVSLGCANVDSFKLFFSFF